MDIAANIKQALKKQDWHGDWKAEDANVDDLQVNLHRHYLWVKAYVGIKLVRKDHKV